MPFRITFESSGCVSPEVYRANVEHAVSLGLPFVSPQPGETLAVAGGGHSLSRHVEALKGYSAVWGINHAAKWLIERGVNASLFGVDPTHEPGMIEGVEKAVLATCTHPNVFAELAGKDVQIFHADSYGDETRIARGGATSACRAPLVALWMGFREVTFFGCEGSYEATSHVYDYAVRPEQIIVRAGARDYVTQPDYLMQCENLSQLIGMFPAVFKEESGGLLRAMIENPDTWEVAGLSGAMAEHLGASPADLPAYQAAL